MFGVRTATLAWIGGILLIGASAVLALAPLTLPPDYSPVELTTSYSAAQGVSGAWAARVGFVIAGGAVLAIAAGLRHRWRQPVTSLQVSVGLAFLAISTFSIRPWRDEDSYDHLENLLHEIAATVMGFAFAVSVVVLVWRRWTEGGVVDRFGVAIAVVSLTAPPAWGTVPSWSGAIQRAMLLMWGAWYLVEIRKGAPANDDVARP